MTSKRKVAANHLNAQHSTGPITRIGKRNSSKNATKHAYFSRQAPLSEAEQADYDALVSKVSAELNPTTILQSDGVNKIVECMRRCELARRLETRTIERLLNDGDPTEPDSSGTCSPPAAWYALTPGDLQKAKVWLESVCSDAATSQSIRDEHKDTFESLFGLAFYQILNQWEELSLDDINMATMIRRKSDAYKMNVPGFTEFKKSAEGTIIDPLQNYQFKHKLLLLQLLHMGDLQRIRRQAPQTAAGTGDFSPRFYANALRDLRRAIEWFWILKDREDRVKG